MLQRRHSTRQPAVAARGERQFVQHDRRPIVEPQIRLVAVGGVAVAVQLVVHVAQLFERAHRRRVFLDRGSKISQRGGQRFGRVSAALVRLTAFQVGEHRPVPEGDRAAEGFDRLEGVPAAQGVVALDDQPAVFPIALHGLVGQNGG